MHGYWGVPAEALHSIPYLLLPATVWLAYHGILSGSWVSDDTAGIAQYDGEFTRHPVQRGFNQNSMAARGSLNVTWHNVLKWLRWHAAKTPNPNKRWKEDKQPPYLPNRFAHHRLNLWAMCGVAVALYLFLSQLIDPTIALLAILLWIVHPLGVQTIGWISGIGYVLSTLFMLCGLNTVLIAHQLSWLSTPLGTIGSLALFGFWQWMAIECFFATMGATIILAFLGFWPFALVSGLLTLYGGLNTLREAVGMRKAVFHEQQMAQSTTFYPKKLVVVLKTLYYDFVLALVPRRLGLYHLFGYHYEMPYIEHEDRHWAAGLGITALLVWGIIVGSVPVQLGSLWFLVFLVLFLNWITANQFVVDRYVWLPSFGLCLIAAALLPLWAVCLVGGIFLCRTWTHLPTYKDEVSFYLSNIWNFPESEVAHGNLGVAYLSQGWIGSAIDTWWKGVELNPEYDVDWYNLASMLRTRGPLNPNYFPRFYNTLPKDLLEICLQKDPMRSHLHLAKYCLERAVKAKTCHFPEPWKKELEALTQELTRPTAEPRRPAQLVHPLLTEAVQ